MRFADSSTSQTSSRTSSTPPSTSKLSRAIVLLNAILIPVFVLTFVPVLALYLLLLAPALPIVVSVLWFQMRHEWSKPETAVGLCTLSGFAIGYALLFVQYFPLIVARAAQLLQRIGS